jgi:hypothetical protein
LFLLLNVFSQSSSKPSCLVGGGEEEIDTTSIDQIHRYNHGLDYLSIGNIGLVGYNLLFDMKEYATFSPSLIIGNKQYLPKQFDVKKPYTELNYILGSKEEQVLKVLHTQNISPLANFSFGFDKVKSKGFYTNQASSNNHLFANTWLKTKNDRYKIGLNIDHERIFNEHNGGVLYDSLFEQDLLLNRNRELMDVNLSFASSTINRTNLQLEQQFQFSQSFDSLNNGFSNAVFTKVSGFKNERIFKDSSLNMSYYNQILIDSLITNDIIKYEGVNGIAGYQFNKRKGRNNLNFSTFVKWQSLNYEQHVIDTIVTSLSVGSKFQLNKKKFRLQLDGNYYLNGYRKMNVDFKGWLSYDFTQDWSVGVLGSYQTISPSLDLRSYYGNNISWENTFSTTDYLRVSGSLTSEKHNVDLIVAYNDVFNPIYFNFIGEPQQIDGVSQVIQFSARKEFDSKKWSIIPKMVYQYNGGYNIYRLPDYYADLTIAYKTKMYKNNLNVFIGADVVYYAPTDMMSFKPMVNQYNLDDTKIAGNYPFVDVFLNARIKTVRFFVKATHVNSGLFGFKYYGANNYPLKDRTIQFGLNWIFIN